MERLKGFKSVQKKIDKFSHNNDIDVDNNVDDDILAVAASCYSFCKSIYYLIVWEGGTLTIPIYRIWY